MKDCRKFYRIICLRNRRGGYVLAGRVQLTPDRDVLLNNGDVRYDKKNNVVITNVPLNSLNKRSRETF